jgi:hypothetical protein
MDGAQLRRCFLRTTIFLVLVNCQSAYSNDCVKDYLEFTLLEARKQYFAIKKQFQLGNVHFTPYSKIGEILYLSPKLRSYESGEVTGSGISENHWISNWIQRLHGKGAELRLLQHEELGWHGRWQRIESPRDAYFAYDFDKRMPYIAVSSSVGPDVLAHEFDHLEKWFARRNAVLNQGLPLLVADINALVQSFDPRATQYLERTAVAKELRVESGIQRDVHRQNPVKWLYPSGALPLYDLNDLTKKLIYPEAEALKVAMENKNPDAPVLMRDLIRKALLLRLTSYERALRALVAPQGSGPKLDVGSHIQYMWELENLDGLFDALFSGMKGRFEVAGNYDKARKLFEAEFPGVWESLPAQKRGEFKPRFEADQ